MRGKGKVVKSLGIVHKPRHDFLHKIEQKRHQDVTESSVKLNDLTDWVVGGHSG